MRYTSMLGAHKPWIDGLVLGREGFAEIVGPSVDQITATPIDPSALTAAGQSALSALNEMLQGNPGGVRTAVGFLRP